MMAVMPIILRLLHEPAGGIARGGDTRAARRRTDRRGGRRGEPRCAGAKHGNRQRFHRDSLKPGRMDKLHFISSVSLN
jgi:hypothetical protein